MSEPRKLKDALYEQFARVGKAMAHPKRVELIDLLCQGPRTVEVLKENTGMTLSTVSHHLQLLKQARLVEAEKEGTYVIYSLADQAVADLWQSMQELAEQRYLQLQKLIDDYFHSVETLEPVDRGQLLERIRNEELVVLDVRPPEEFEAGHLPNALSVPLEKLQEQLDSLPVDRKVVAYCRGPYCVLAVEAVKLLRKHGYEAERLEESVPAWRSRGLPVKKE